MPPQSQHWKVVREVGRSETLYDGHDAKKANAIFDRAGKALKIGRVKLLLNGSATASFIGMRNTAPVLRRVEQATRPLRGA